MLLYTATEDVDIAVAAAAVAARTKQSGEHEAMLTAGGDGQCAAMMRRDEAAASLPDGHFHPTHG